MTCLDDRELLAVHLGDAPPASSAHAVACARCAGRLRALAHDLSRIDAVLRSTAPPRAVRRPGAAWRWAPAALAAVVALVVLVARERTTPALDDDTLALADELGATLAYDPTAATEASARSTCTWGDPFLAVGCEEPAVMQVAWR